MKFPYQISWYLVVVILGIILSCCNEARGSRRSRRETRANAHLDAINSEFHLMDTPQLQRIIRQVRNKDEKIELEEEEDAADTITLSTTAKATTTTPKNVTIATSSPPTGGASLLGTPPTGGGSILGTPATAGGSLLGTPPTPATTLPKPSPPKPSPPKIDIGEVYLPAGYNRLEIPKLKFGRRAIAVPVVLYINLRSIRDYNENEETITFEMDLIVEWLDGELFDITKVDPTKAPIQKTLNPVFLRKIWTPDIYMDDLISIDQPELMAKPIRLTFSPNTGFMSYTSRVAAKVNCDMFFHYYPADTQVCEFHLKSYAFYDTDLELSWLLHGVYLQEPAEPNFDIQVSSIETIKTLQPYNNPKNETRDTLVFTILARRKLSYHLVQTYLPSIFFIIITWLCFLIPSKFIEARIGISMTTLLTLVAMFASVRESTPIVSYVKAIDLWMVFCIFFVFLTLLEFSILIWMRAIKEDAMENEAAAAEAKNSDDPRGRAKNFSETSSHHSTTSATLRAHGVFTELVEKYAFIIFSIIFVVFNIIYWTWLLEASEYFQWDVNSTHTSIDED